MPALADGSEHHADVQTLPREPIFRVVAMVDDALYVCNKILVFAIEDKLGERTAEICDLYTTDSIICLL